MKSRVSTTSPTFTRQTFVLSITRGCSLQTALTQIHRRQKHLSNKSAPRPESPRLLSVTLFRLLTGHVKVSFYCLPGRRRT